MEKQFPTPLRLLDSPSPLLGSLLQIKFQNKYKGSVFNRPWLERLLSVGEEAILREARQWLLTGPVCVAAAGDADAIAAQLEAEVSGPVRVISRDELCR